MHVSFKFSCKFNYSSFFVSSLFLIVQFLIQLQTFLLKLKKDLFSKADLSATILTGVSEEGLELFSKYIENTCDVQTISLILLWSLPSTICKKPLSKTWIENYKYLLDCWRLWNIRYAYFFN